MLDPWLAAFLSEIFHGGVGDGLDFDGINVNVTNQIQVNSTIIDHAEGDVSVTNVQTSVIDQDISGAGIHFGGSGPGGAHFDGESVGLTNQAQADPMIARHPGGDAIVTDFQGTETHQGVPGPGLHCGSDNTGGSDPFEGLDVNVTNQIQVNPTIIGDADGEVSVANFQVNGVDHEISGAALHFGNFSFV